MFYSSSLALMHGSILSLSISFGNNFESSVLRHKASTGHIQLHTTCWIDTQNDYNIIMTRQQIGGWGGQADRVINANAGGLSG